MRVFCFFVPCDTLPSHADLDINVRRSAHMRSNIAEVQQALLSFVFTFKMSLKVL